MRLLLIILVLMTAFPAKAQEGSPGIRRQEPQNRTAPHETAEPSGNAARQIPADPGLSGIAGGCFNPGAGMTVLGNHLASNPEFALSLRVAGKTVPLDILNRSDKRFVVKLPDTVLEEGKDYTLVLSDRSRMTISSLPLRLCPRAAQAGPVSQKNQNSFLVMAAPGLKSAITGWLADRNVSVLDVQDLPALDAILITAAPVTVDTLASFRSRFPEAAIDRDDDLSPAKGARVYAPGQIGWPDDPGCLPKPRSLKVGLIDGKIHTSHPAFRNQKIVEKNFTGPDNAGIDHATAIASILIGNDPGEGFTGLLRGQDLYSAVALRSSQDRQELASVRAVILSLGWLLGEDVRLVNLSLTTERNNSVLKRGIESATDRGAIVFAAAGNGGPQAPPAYPAAYDRVVAVTAIDVAGRLYKHANRGSYIDFAAPGVDIWVAGRKGGTYSSGTSLAVPYALGTAAIVMRENPAMPRDLALKIMNDAFSSDGNSPDRLRQVSRLCR